MSQPWTAPEPLWFGESWGSPGNEQHPRVNTPVGELCKGECGKRFVEGDQGIHLPPFPGPPENYHRACWAPTERQLASGTPYEEYDEYGPP